MPAGNPFSITDANVVHLWASETWYSARIKDSFFDPRYKLAGGGDTGYQEYPIVLIDDFEGGPGADLTISLMQDVDGRGTVGGEQIAGTETMHSYDTFSMKCQTQRFAHKVLGLFVDPQQVPYKAKEDGKKAIVERYTRRRAVVVANHLCGNSRQTDLAYCGQNAVTDYDTEHIWRCGAAGGLGLSTDQAVGADTAAILDVDTLDTLVAIAESSDPPIRPWMAGGNPYYILAVHSDVVVQMRKKTTQWYDEMKAALHGGMIKDNPIFTRALGMHNNVLIMQNNFLTQGRNSSTSAAVNNTRRSVFMGAGAIAMGYGVLAKDPGDGQRLLWHHELQDHGAKYSCSGTWNWGVKRLDFPDAAGVTRSYGSIAVTSYAPPVRQHKMRTGPGVGQYILTYDLGQPQP